MATLDISPTKVGTHQVRTITFIGSGTSWLSSAPTFTPSDPHAPDNAALVAAISVGSVTVVSDTVATVSVTYVAPASTPLTAAQSLTGTLQWTDSTTGATRNQLVGTIARWVPRRF
jgi:hypothetical protein